MMDEDTKRVLEQHANQRTIWGRLDWLLFGARWPKP